MNTKDIPISVQATAFVLLWNSGFIGAEYGLPYVGPFSLLFWRYWALSVILIIYLLSRKRLQWPGRPMLAYVCGIGILSHGVWLSCVMVSLHRGVPAGMVALIVALQPLATAAFSGWVVGEYPRWSQWLGLLIGFGGVALAVGSRSDLTEVESLISYLLPLGSVIAITGASLLQRWMVIRGNQPHLPVDSVMFYQSLGTAIAISIPAITLEGLDTQWTPVLIGTLTWLILVVSLLAYGLMWILLTRMKATQVASLFYLGPPVTMVMAWIALGDIPQLMDGVGLGVVVLGVTLVQR